jgi:TRAP-type C4-dicarboxylate transport system substrate-binding protein
MKKVLLCSICFVIVAVAIPISISYGKDKVIELRYGMWVPPKKPAGNICQVDIWNVFCDEITRRSRGRMRVTYYPGAALGKPIEHLHMVEKGIVDFSYSTMSWYPGRFPLSMILSLPMDYPSYWVAAEISEALFDRILYKEYESVHAFAPGGMGQFYLNLTKPVKTLEEFKGLRIRDPGGVLSRVLKALGATPVMMPLPEVYMSMERGVIDGAIMIPYMMKVFSIHEVTKFTLKFQIGCAIAGTLMNKNSWDKLPADLKPIVEGAGRKLALNRFITQDYCEDKDMEKVAKAGPMYVLPPKEAERWHAAIRPVVQQWVADREAEGLPGKEVVSIFREECEKRGVPWPY